MTIELEVQIACSTELLPSQKDLENWVSAALEGYADRLELCIRLVNAEEMADLNSTYRHKAGPTNVLSFPLELPDGISLDSLPIGDIVICPEILVDEAKNQKKPLAAHWAHIVIHGCLHLIGYDHIIPEEAIAMESLETTILAQLGIANPYLEPPEAL